MKQKSIGDRKRGTLYSFTDFSRRWGEEHRNRGRQQGTQKKWWHQRTGNRSLFL